MARIDLNRMRKIYPQMKRSPRWFNQTNEVETHKITFSNDTSKTFSIGTYTTPVVVLSPEDNLNVWISSIVGTSGGVWKVTITSSVEIAAGSVNVHVAEGTP